MADDFNRALLNPPPGWAFNSLKANFGIADGHLALLSQESGIPLCAHVGVNLPIAVRPVWIEVKLGSLFDGTKSNFGFGALFRRDGVSKERVDVVWPDLSGNIIAKLDGMATDPTYTIGSTPGPLSPGDALRVEILPLPPLANGHLSLRFWRNGALLIDVTDWTPPIPVNWAAGGQRDAFVVAPSAGAPNPGTGFPHRLIDFFDCGSL